MRTYRLLTYVKSGKAKAGILIKDQVFDVSVVTGKPSYESVLDVLNDWETAQGVLESATESTATRRGISIEEARILAPVLYPSAIYCAGANYVDHVREMASARGEEPDPDPRALGLNPWHFIKASRSVIGTGASIRLPEQSRKVDWEAELAAVIGRPAKNVPTAKALEYVAGYTIAGDLSARDLSARPQIPNMSPFKYDWVGQKSFDGSCPVGPWIVPARDIPDPQNLGIKLWVNDVLKQDSHTGKMIFSVAEQLSHLSTRMTLHPGDLILTGTPAGVGAARGEFLKSGDVVKIWIEEVGALTNTMV